MNEELGAPSPEQEKTKEKESALFAKLPRSKRMRYAHRVKN